MALGMHQASAALGALSRDKLQGGLIAAVSSGRLARGSNTYRNLTLAADLLVQADSMATSNPGGAGVKLAEATRLFRREEEICLGSKRFSDDQSMDPYCSSFGMETFATMFRKEALRVSSLIAAAPPEFGAPVLAARWGEGPALLPYVVGVGAVIGLLVIAKGLKRRRA
jgi:hypothetical protein